ncbi:CCA tRNA nucleotidyltransferase [Peptostreptococcus russellii]|uniref:CCA tRNA nucleotidyltransferase n=1 Tax=Peptostreptococcus russellii TaxID=215200 RepID=UPI001629E7C3|nr:CCA tRNA nucleotidyltransferase [Peptostreptococcus russellii]MBC2577246.1 CCA tRNA nucleotidyltransferase [Peptostreptococcus russellii]
MNNKLEKIFAPEIDSGANFIIEELEKNGYEGFVVGGCVRDTIMGRKPNDWDIATNAKPDEVMRIFRKTIPTGIEHGTVTVMINKVAYELTTYRIDGEYVDMRHPEKVEFSKNIVDDLSRRDFTINAMAYNKRIGLVDKFGGMDDIENKLIRCVGNPNKRFNEDALRMIRAVRFSAKLGFKIEEKTFQSILKNASNIKKISIERINKELEETIKFDPESLFLLNKMDISEYLFGVSLEKNNLKIAKKVDGFLRGYNLYKKNEKELINALKRAFILEKLDVCNLKNILRKLRYSRKDIDMTSKLHSILKMNIYDHITDENMSTKERKVMIKYILKDTGDLLLAKYAIYSRFIEKNSNPTVCFSEFNDIIESGECFSTSQLDLNGKDIIENDIAKGAAVGILLNAMLEYVILNPKENEKEKLLAFAKNYKIM